jgi:hypothetical protein
MTTTSTTTTKIPAFRTPRRMGDLAYRQLLAARLHRRARDELPGRVERLRALPARVERPGHLPARVDQLRAGLPAR